MQPVSAKPKMQERLNKSTRPLTRRSDRRPANALVQVQSSHGERTTARLNDISAYGCNVVSDAAWLRLGVFVSLSVSETRTVQAVVRWSRNGSCGVEFLRPIPDSEADTLAEQWG
jgi:hypothetical protein